MVAHLAQVASSNRFRVSEVDASGVDVGIRREGWLVPGPGDEGARDAASLADEPRVHGADAAFFQLESSGPNPAGARFSLSQTGSDPPSKCAVP